MMIGLDKKLDVSGRWGGRANILEHDIWALFGPVLFSLWRLLVDCGLARRTNLYRTHALLTLFNLVYLGNVFSG